jgi:hypothetical protein
MKDEMSIDLRQEYKPVALYLEDADTVEYVRADVPCVYRRIDGILTLALDMKNRELIGFRLKGFKNFYIRHLQPTYKLLDSDFIPLVSVIERAVAIIGDEITTDDKRVTAYRQAREIAREDKVEVQMAA